MEKKVTLSHKNVFWTLVLRESASESFTMNGVFPRTEVLEKGGKSIKKFKASPATRPFQQIHVIHCEMIFAFVATFLTLWMLVAIDEAEIKLHLTYSKIAFWNGGLIEDIFIKQLESDNIVAKPNQVLQAS